MSSTKVVQFVGSFMVNKPNDLQPNDGQALVPTRIIQSNPTGDILGSLTTTSQEGGFGGTDTSHRSMIYLSPSMTFFVNDKLGSHEFRGGADLYPNIENKTSSSLAPVEFYFRPPGTTGSGDVLFERDILRGFDGGTSVSNDAYEHHYGAYFQDRWKPSSRVAVKAGVRLETTSVFTDDRQRVLGSLLPPALPTNPSDREFHQNVAMPNFGISLDAGAWGVFRGTVAPNRNLGLLTSATTTPAGALSSATPQIVAPSALGTLIKGGPLASFNYNWVVSSTKVFQFVGSFMINKPNDLQPIDGQGLIPTKVIQTNPAGNILGSLTTTALEGGFGATDTSHRSMIYLSPSMTFFVKNKLGSHEFRAGGDLYPNIQNKTSSNLAPVEFYFRPPGTTGNADVTDPYGGDIFAVNLNYDAIQDVEVKALGAEASDGSSMVGQFMNIVTKSGGNSFHGSAALFLIPQRFNGTNVQGIPANR
ncbi:MAG: hypothetical protein DMF93_03550, partial [Acidobacteria bacterium]